MGFDATQETSFVTNSKENPNPNKSFEDFKSRNSSSSSTGGSSSSVEFDEEELQEDIPSHKPVIFVNYFKEEDGLFVNKEQHVIGEEAWEILKQSDRELYRKSGVIVTPCPGDFDNIVFRECDTDTMIGILSEEILFIKLKLSKGKIIPDIIPIPNMAYAKYVLKNCDLTELNEVTSVVSHPFLYRKKIEDADTEAEWGEYKENTDITSQFEYSVISEDGIHVPTGVYINKKTTVDIVTYNTLEEADKILNDIFGDFAYGDDASLSNTIGQLITGVCRYAMGTDMPPIALTTSQTHGSGKTMETDVIHTVLYGHTVDWNPKIKTLDEYRKTLLTNAISGTPMVCFDNLNAKLDIETLASVATAKRISGRILHTMTSVAVRNYMQICINGTAMDISTEIADRTIWKVMSTEEKAADREFKYKALIDQQVLPNRKYILSAVFTYIENWIKKGCPISEEKQKMHRQKVWAALIGGILQDTIWYDNFLGNTAEQRIQADTTYVRWTHSLRELALHIRTEPGVNATFPFTVADAMPICSYFDYELDEETLKKKVFDPDNKDEMDKYKEPFHGYNMLGEDIGTECKNHHSRTTRLGILFREKSKNNGTPFGNWKIVDNGQYQRRRSFRLVWIGDGDVPDKFSILADAKSDVDDISEETDDGINL